MSISEFNDSEFGQTWTWVQERSKAKRHERDQNEEMYYLSRLNTFYLISAWTKGIKDPKDLYKLPGDEESKKKITENMNPFSEEAQAAFDKMDKMKFDKNNGDFLKEIQWRQQ